MLSSGLGPENLPVWEMGCDSEGSSWMSCPKTITSEKQVLCTNIEQKLPSALYQVGCQMGCLAADGKQLQSFFHPELKTETLMWRKLRNGVEPLCNSSIHTTGP